MESVKNNFPWFILLVIAVFSFFAWVVLGNEDLSGTLSVSFLDVGQGDAILITAPSGSQMMIDGGPDSGVLRQLSKLMPFYDRSLNVILVSNPDKDHISGLIDVLRAYRVDLVVEPGTETDTAVYQEFSRAVSVEKAELMDARRGMEIDLGGGAVFEILFPDREASGLDTNTGSIIGRLTFGETCMIFPGDAPQSIEEYIVKLEGKGVDCEVLKVGHHGSRTSTSGVFLSVVSPELVMISAGLNNKYGHPHKEVIDRLNDAGATIFKTYDKGVVTVFSDGKTVTLD